MNGGSGGAFALDTKLLHPRPKAMGVEQQSAVLEKRLDLPLGAALPQSKSVAFGKLSLLCFTENAIFTR